MAIVGIGQTAYGKALPGTAWDLAAEAILAALADAGLEPGDVDGMCRFAPPFEPVSEPQLVRALGIPELRFFAESPLGGEALGAVLAHAAAAVKRGTGQDRGGLPGAVAVQGRPVRAGRRPGTRRRRIPRSQTSARARHVVSPRRTTGRSPGRTD